MSCRNYVPKAYSAGTPAKTRRKLPARRAVASERLKRRVFEIVSQPADCVVGYDVFRPHDRECGNGNAGCERFQHDVAERISQAREDEDVGGRVIACKL